MPFGTLGFLGNFGDAGGAGGERVLRRVVYSGGMQYNQSLIGSGDVQTMKQSILDIFNQKGWSINSLSLSQEYYGFSVYDSAIGFTLDINLSSAFSADEGRLAAKTVLENIYGGVTGGAFFTDVYVQIVSDAGVPISQNVQTPASTPTANVINTVQTAAVKTANQIATQGVVPTAAQGLDTLLFGGKTFDFLGLKIPQILVYAGVAVVGIPLVMDLVQGKRR